jgi:hypothetical protein
MMNTRYKVHVWPNSHPKGGGGHIHSSSMENHANSKHPSMLAQTKNTEDNRHDDHHRTSLYMDINHSRYLSSPQHMSISMDNHSFSPTVTMTTLKRYKPIKMDNNKESNMKSSIRSHVKKDTYNVHGNVSHTKSLLRHKHVIKFGNSHKTSTPQDQLKMVEYEASHMESLTQLYMKRNNYDVPSTETYIQMLSAHYGTLRDVHLTLVSIICFDGIKGF